MQNAKVKLAIVTLMSSLLLSAAIANAGEIANVFSVIDLDDPYMALENDAIALDLDLNTATYEEVLSWSVYESDEFTIRRLKGSGLFTYLNKQIEWGEVERGKEPITVDEIEIQALDLLGKLGLPFDQIGAINVHYISAQTEDEEGNDVGPITTIGFLV